MANNKIQIKRSSVPGRVPTALQLDVGEFAVNLVDNRLFTKNASNTVIEVLGQSLNTTANVTFSQVNAGNVVTTQVDGSGGLVLNQSGGSDTIIIKNNGHETIFTPAGTIKPAGSLLGGTSDSNQVDVTLAAPLKLKGLLYGVELTASPDGGTTNHVWTFGTDGDLDAPGNITTEGTVTANTLVGNLAWNYITSKPDLKIDITGDATGTNTFVDLANGAINITLANTAVTPGSYGNNSAVPVITIDSKGRITFASTNTIAGIVGMSYSASNNTLTLTSSNGSVYTTTIGTVNTLAVSNTLLVTGVGTFSNDVIVSGNLIVSGTTTYINTTELDVGDNIVTLNADLTGTPSENAGVNVNRGTSANVAVLWNESSDAWTFTNDGSTYLRIASNNDVDAAYSNAVSFATTEAATAYSNAASYADTKAANAYSNAVSYTDTSVATAYSNATSYADTKAATAYSNAASYADTKAATAYSNAASYADTKSSEAYSNAVSVAATDAFSKAATAYSNAASYADTKAATAYSNAVSTASADASSKAATAYSNAVSYADTKAATAYSNAVSYADTKAAEAYTNSVSYAAANSYVNAQLDLKANLAGPTFTGTVTFDGPVVAHGNVTISNTVAAGNTTITGFANISANVDVGGTLRTSASGIRFSDGSVQVSAPLDPIVYAIALG